MLPSHGMPVDESWIARELQALRADMQTLKSTVAGLAAVQQQVSFLAGQTTVVVNQRDFYYSGGIPVSITPPYDPNLDATVSFNAPGTGSVLVVVSARMGMRLATGATAGNILAYFQCVNSAGSVIYDSMVLGTDSNIYYNPPSVTAGGTGVSAATYSAARVSNLTPGASYTIRVRALLELQGSGSATNHVASVNAPTLTVTKLGM